MEVARLSPQPEAGVLLVMGIVSASECAPIIWSGCSADHLARLFARESSRYPGPDRKWECTGTCQEEWRENAIQDSCDALMGLEHRWVLSDLLARPPQVNSLVGRSIFSVGEACLQHNVWTRPALFAEKMNRRWGGAPERRLPRKSSSRFQCGCRRTVQRIESQPPSSTHLAR